ncbi:MAG TPA: hypothetical protein VGD36_01925 [Xanthobacteraceae bacterium]
MVLAVPALGGTPTLSKVAKKAAQALKLARGADARSKKALTLAQRTAGRIEPGTNGTSGTPGGNGVPGPAGPQGAPGPAGARKIDFRAPVGTGDTKVLDFGGLVLTARCDPGPNLSVKASSTVAESEFHLAGVTGTPAPNPTTTAVYSDHDHLGPGSTPVDLPGRNFQGTFTYSTPAGGVITGTVAAEQTAFNGKTDCWFGGWALHNPA